MSTPSRPTSTLPAPDAGGRKRWRLRQSPQRGRLQHSGLPALVALVLENRGIGTTAEAQLFLGGKSSAFADTSAYPGFDAALPIIRAAIKDKSRICVYGDFDVDGMTSTAILTETLRDLGADVLPYIPSREREGYGLNLQAMDYLADRGIQLLITCDCGTSNLAEAARARELGLDVIIVDHHLPPHALPDANALINARLPGHAYPFSDYCTAGVAFRLAEAIYDDAHRPFPEARYADLAALGTVADMVPLLGENREIVRRGLDAIANTERAGLLALISVAGYKPKDVTAETIGFNLAPRLNAAGRLSDASLALELLMTQEDGTAFALAATIDGLNQERQRLTAEAQKRAREMMKDRPGLPLTMVGDAGFHQGVIGLVASRLVEVFGRPAIVYQRGEVESRASCRSIPEFDITGALRTCDGLFERYGGHHQAAGFTIRNDRLAELEERLLAHAGALLASSDLTPSLDIDAEWPLNALRSDEIRWLGKLQPYGMGNPEPRLLSRNVTVVEARGVGQNSQHLRLKLKSGAVVWPAICFGWEGDIPAEGSHVDLVYSLSSDRYGPGEQGGALQLTVVDLAPSS